jgi:hypothetical protein
MLFGGVAQSKGAITTTWTISAADSGSWNAEGTRASGSIYIAEVNTVDAYAFHNYFVFDLSGITGKVVSAKLELANSATGTNPVGGTYTTYGVSTGTAALKTPATGAKSIYLDLGGDHEYGSAAVSYPTTPQPTVEVVFDLKNNPFILADLQSSLGKPFAVGGAFVAGYLPSPPAQPNTLPSTAYVFGQSSNTMANKLIIETSPVPEPSTLIVWSLLGTLAVGLGWWRRRKAA